MYEKSSLLCKLSQSPKKLAEKESASKEGEPHSAVRIESLVAISKGFVAGCSNATFRLYSLALLRTASASEMFQCTTTWSVNGHTSEIMSMALSPNEDSLVSVLSDNQIMTNSMVNPSNLKNEDVKEVMCKFHGPGAITGMDLCMRKPLAVTSGLDKTVRIWDYLDFKLEFFKQFNEDPLSVAFHPSGLHLLVGFADKLRLMNVLMDDIRPFREISIKMCRECRFSHGGQYFAAVNGNIISIFDFYTGDKVQDMRGHNSKVSCEERCLYCIVVQRLTRIAHRRSRDSPGERTITPLSRADRTELCIFGTSRREPASATSSRRAPCTIVPSVTMSTSGPLARRR